MSRADGRGPDELRPIEIEPDFIPSASGSALFRIGQTRLICTAMVEESVPPWMRGRGTGWVTSEYGMLPGSTSERKSRDASRGRVDGRTVEIQRLVGRSLRSVVDFKALGERTVWLDCDVIQADGGTRTASITGAYIALALAMERLVAAGILKTVPLIDSVAATSVGVVDGVALLDLAYEEDSRAEVDMNVVMLSDGGLVETQATAEQNSYTRTQLSHMLDYAEKGIKELLAAQRTILEAVT
jgi:ribonuclease PH